MKPDVILSQRINMPEVRRMAAWASESPGNREQLWELVGADDRQTSVNALWVMTRLTDTEPEWLLSLRNELIDMLLTEKDPSRKRMLLKLLREQQYDADDIRTDFLDYCMSKINSECEPYAVRCFSIYCAFKMCRHFPELVAELEEHLDMMAFQSLSPGLKSALRQTKSKIGKLKLNLDQA